MSEQYIMIIPARSDLWYEAKVDGEEIDRPIACIGLTAGGKVIPLVVTLHGDIVPVYEIYGFEGTVLMGDDDDDDDDEPEDEPEPNPDPTDAELLNLHN